MIWLYFIEKLVLEIRWLQEFSCVNAFAKEMRQVRVCKRNASGMRFRQKVVCVRNSLASSRRMRQKCVRVGKASGMRLRQKYISVRNSLPSSMRSVRNSSVMQFSRKFFSFHKQIKIIKKTSIYWRLRRFSKCYFGLIQAFLL